MFYRIVLDGGAEWFGGRVAMEGDRAGCPHPALPEKPLPEPQFLDSSGLIWCISMARVHLESACWPSWPLGIRRPPEIQGRVSSLVTSPARGRVDTGTDWHYLEPWTPAV